MSSNRFLLLLIVSTTLAGTCSWATQSGVREQRVPADAVSATLMALGEEALTFCPGPDATDARASITAAERAGWPRFVDNDDVREEAEDFSGPFGPRDFDKISRRVIIGGESQELRGSVELIIGQRERSTYPGGMVKANSIGCAVTVRPRQQGPGLVTDAEAEAAVRMMGRLAGREPSYIWSNEAASAMERESTTVWGFRRTAGGWDTGTGDLPRPGERWRTYYVNRRPIGLFYSISSADTVVPLGGP